MVFCHVESNPILTGLFSPHSPFRHNHQCYLMNVLERRRESLIVASERSSHSGSWPVHFQVCVIWSHHLHVCNWIKARGTCLWAERTTGHEIRSAKASYSVMAKWWSQTLSFMFGIWGTRRAVERSWEGSRGWEMLHHVNACLWGIWPPRLVQYWIFEKWLGGSVFYNFWLCWSILKTFLLFVSSSCGLTKKVSMMWKNTA